MKEEFTWSPSEDQIYSEKNVKKTIYPIHSFNKNFGKSFMMDPGDPKDQKKYTLTLSFNNPNSDNNPDDNYNYSIHWPIKSRILEPNESYKVYKSENTNETSTGMINISSGDLIISGHKEYGVYFYLNPDPDIVEMSTIKLQKSGTLTIENSVLVSLKGPINPTVDMSGNSEFRIKKPENIENIENTISLGNCYFSMTESSQATLESRQITIDGSSIILQDNAQMFIIAPRLDITIPKDEKQSLLPLPSLTFTLKAGATSLNLNSPDGCNFPLDIDRKPPLDIDFPKGVFNFMAEGEENTGKVVIDVLPEYANAYYGLNIMLRKNFIAINRKVVENGDQMKYFDFKYGKDIRGNKQVGTITISLRNPNLKLPSK
ncbi:hypothetical protein [Photorhabdus khanii]|uniref:Uncharacterized protein n=1 Tax=Photorhabdus khanii subsp. guanajuatensis TaxID=2100166 RepID=A0A4R4IR64_9GAMM|nr:hypothetical protein [Photorhabdus khanii]TDB43190.1 hypothetical protein C5467_23545 [Photorhabdus khanii subsp. guanajuatensis]